jgi:rhamnosyltransferase subunit B
MQILLVPFGSAGDIHPFAGMGAELRARGHRVTMITSGAFEPLARDEGLDFCDVMSAADYRTVLGHRHLWDPLRSYWTFFKIAIVPTLRPVFHAIAERHVPGETIVVAQGHALGARIACEKLGVPLVTCHLAPYYFRSVYENRQLSGMSLPQWFPPSVKRGSFWVGDRLTDRLVGPMVNGFRAELGLPPVRRIIWHWWNSPELIVGLFPPWFGQPQADWPPQTRLTGFPLYDGKTSREAPAGLIEFLDAGERPIVFTPGTSMAHGEEFFRVSIEAARQLGRRAVLVTRFRDQLPAALPEGVLHVDFVPFEFLLARAAALVHHGGIGSASQALAAGIPQLLRPMASDQPDNAYRLCQLGVAERLMPREYRVRAVVRALDRLLNSHEVKANCQRWAAAIGEGGAIRRTCDLVEGLGHSCRSHVTC